MDLLEEAAVLEHDGGLTGQQLKEREVVLEEARPRLNEDRDDADATASDRERRGHDVARHAAAEFRGKLPPYPGVFGGDER